MTTPRSHTQIVPAATALFRRFGVRHTSMNQIATEAGVARATLYSHFKNKEEVFVAVAEDICARILADTRRAKAEPGSLAERLTGMLEAKFTTLFTLMVQTPHALELMETQLRLCGDVVRATDETYLSLLGQTLAAAQRAKEIALARAGLSVPAAARWLVTASRGADVDAKTETAHRAHLAEVVRVLLRAARR